MEVHFTPEQEAKLAQIAEDAQFRAAARAGIAQADRGPFIEDHEMNDRRERMLNSRRGDAADA